MCRRWHLNPHVYSQHTQDTCIHSTSVLKYTYLFSFEGVNGYFCICSFIVNDSLYILWYTLWHLKKQCIRIKNIDFLKKCSALYLQTGKFELLGMHTLMHLSGPVLPRRLDFVAIHHSMKCVKTIQSWDTEQNISLERRNINQGIWMSLVNHIFHHKHGKTLITLTFSNSLNV
jgi:hypothetical protein